jgi:hypothetical protein
MPDECLGLKRLEVLSNLHRVSDFNRNGVLDGADEIIANCLSFGGKGPHRR